MKSYFINRPNLERLIRSISKDYTVYAPVLHEGNRYYKKVEEDILGDIALDGTRAVETIKSFYFPARSRLTGYFLKDPSDKRRRPIAIIGAKSCDMASLKIMDYVFTQEPFGDPAYISQREDGLIISSDCTSYNNTCFCVALGIMPYPEDGFDINLSEIESGYISEIGSEKGERLVKEYAKLFQNSDLYIERRDLSRKKLKDELYRYVSSKNLPQADTLQERFRKSFNSSLWEETARTCVECGACNFICPACHCFILADQQGEQEFERLRLWDSCLLFSFAKVAGGANPRKFLYQRLRNRFDKKFNFFPDVLGRFGCTGCGRCIEACPGKIDIREVLSKLAG